MPDDRRDQAAGGDVGLRLLDAFGQARDRHTDIGGHALGPGAQAHRGPVDIMARLPEPRAILGARGPVERAAAKLLCDLAEALGLFLDALIRAVELHEQHRRFRQGELRIEVAGPDLKRVEQLDPRHRQPALDGQDRGIAGSLDTRERAHARRDRLGDALKFQRDLRDQAEGSFRADEQPGQVVASGRLLGPARRGHDLAIRQHDLQRQHIVLHRAVAHGIRAGGTRRRHAAKRRIGPRIDGKEQSDIAQMLVQHLAGDAGFDHAVEVFRMHGDDALHHRGVDRNAAERRVDVALEGCARAEGHDRHIMRGTQLHDGRDLFRGLGVDHQIRRLIVDPGQRVGMLLPDREAADQPVAQHCAKRLPDCVDGLRRRRLTLLPDRHVHVPPQGSVVCSDPN